VQTAEARRMLFASSTYPHFGSTPVLAPGCGVRTLSTFSPTSRVMTRRILF
jgi:hypothetical protein